MASRTPTEFVDIEGEPRRLISTQSLETESSESESDEAVVEDHDGGDDPTQNLISLQPTSNAPVPALRSILKRKAKGKKGSQKPKPVIEPSPTIIQDGIHRRGPKTRDHFDIPSPPLQTHARIAPQSRTGGWAEESDSDDDPDVYREVKKMDMNPMFQIYLVGCLVLIVALAVGSVKLYELYYGKPKIPENTFDFMKDKDDD